MYFHSSIHGAEILQKKGGVVPTPNMKKNTETLSWYVLVNKVETVFFLPYFNNCSISYVICLYFHRSVPIAEMFIPEDLNVDASTSLDEHDLAASNAVWRPHRIGSLVPEHFSTPRRARRHLNMALAQKAKKIKCLQQIIRRLTKQVTSLSSVIQQLKEKKLISDSTEDVFAGNI